MKTIKIISVNSLAAHKTISLKAQLSILGSSILSVPTILLNGANSFVNVQKQYTDLQPLLESTIELGISQKQELYLFIGYLADVKNVPIVLDCIKKYKQYFSGIFTDPISGDNGKPYIDQNIIKLWPEILSLSNFAFPNITELKLYSGLSFSEESIENHAKAFADRFPNLNYIITSYCPSKEKTGVLLSYYKKRKIIPHKKYETSMDGAGDVFVSYFLKFYLLKKIPPERACKKALSATLKLISKAYSSYSNEFEIIP